jgi:hypothetical protein
MRKSLWIIPFLFAVIGAPNAHAQTTYTYTGSAFNSFATGYGCTEGVGECSFTGSFTIASPIPDSESELEVYPESFDFMDGVQVCNSATDCSLVNSSFFVDTSPTGAITSWNIYLYGDVANPENEWAFEIENGGAGDGDYVGDILYGNYEGENDASNMTAGTFSSTPEPPSTILFSTGLLGIIFVVRKRLFA